MRTRVTELLGIKYPIIEGGLVSVGNPELAAAVSNAGGLGVIGAGGKTKEELVQEIRLTRRLTVNPFGVNVPISVRQESAAHMEAVIEEKVPVVTTSAGNPEPFVRQLHEAGVKVLTVVPTVRLARKAESVGVDAVVTMGIEAGGHPGPDEIATMVLVPLVADAVDIPVIAAGGIADARGFLAALVLGAEGVQMGTRFVATKECIAHSAYKEALCGASETSTVVIERSIGRVARVLKGAHTQKILEMEKAGTPIEDLLPYISGPANRRAAIEGDIDGGYAFCGQVAGMLHEVLSVSEVIEGIVQGAALLSRRFRELEV